MVMTFTVDATRRIACLKSAVSFASPSIIIAALALPAAGNKAGETGLPASR
jgi:hypothetical protein